MAVHFRRVRGPRWRLKTAVNLASAAVAAVVVLVFAVTKFTEGAWLVVVVFPALTLVLIRLHQGQGRREAEVLAALPDSATRPNQAQPDPRRGRCHRPGDPAGHPVRPWPAPRRTAGGARCPGRRTRPVVAGRVAGQARAGAGSGPGRLSGPAPGPRRHDLVRGATGDGNIQVTVLLPRRTYSPLLGRLMHDHTTEHLARAVSRIPSAAATIVPFDVNGALKTATCWPEPSTVDPTVPRVRHPLAGVAPMGRHLPVGPRDGRRPGRFRCRRILWPGVAGRACHTGEQFARLMCPDPALRAPCTAWWKVPVSTLSGRQFPQVPQRLRRGRCPVSGRWYR